MKKIILVFSFFVIPFISNCQVVKVDSLNCDQSKILAERLLEFHNENRVSQAMMVTGAVFYTLGTFINNEQPNKINAVQIIGGVTGGTVS